jgi:hypothetical protein
LQPDAPVVLSIVHQVGAIAVLVAALAPDDLRGRHRPASRKPVLHES